MWSQISKLYLTPGVEFAAHLVVFKHVFRDWDSNKMGPVPIWSPNQQTLSATNASKFMRKHRALLADPALQVRDERWFLQSALVRDWRVLHALSVQRPDVFWHAFLRVCFCNVCQ